MSLETVAVYSEHPVRAYALGAEAGHALLAARVAGPGLTAAGEALAGLEEDPRLAFLAASPDDGGLALCLCLTADEAPALAKELTGLGLEVGWPPLPVSLIHLQGPHYGDRFGILAAALAGLEEAGVTARAVSGAVHSLYLALDPDDAPAALNGLARHFCGPGGAS